MFCFQLTLWALANVDDTYKHGRYERIWIISLCLMSVFTVKDGQKEGQTTAGRLDECNWLQKSVCFSYDHKKIKETKTKTHIQTCQPLKRPMRKNWSSVRQKWGISESNEESSATRTSFFFSNKHDAMNCSNVLCIQCVCVCVWVVLLPWIKCWIIQLDYFFFFFFFLAATAIRQDEQGGSCLCCVHLHVCMNMYASVFVYVYVEYSCLKLILSNSTQLFFLFLQLKMNKVFLSDKAVCVYAYAWTGV